MKGDHKKRWEREAGIDPLFQMVAAEMARIADLHRDQLQARLKSAIREVDRVEDSLKVNKLLRDVLGPTTREVEGN